MLYNHTKYTIAIIVLFEKLKYNKEEMLKQKIGGIDMDYLTVKEAAEKWGITARMVTYHCVAGRIKGAVKKGNLWLVPGDSKKPDDGRYKSNKKNKPL